MFVCRIIIVLALVFSFRSLIQQANSKEGDIKILLGSSKGLFSLVSENSIGNIKGIGIYLHQSGVIQLFENKQGQLFAKALDKYHVQANVAEISMPLKSDGSFDEDQAKNYFTPGKSWSMLFVDQGLRPTTCNINGLDVSGKHQSIKDWVQYASFLTTAGLRSCGAFGDPNNGDTASYEFYQPYWDFYRAVAVELGGVALDTPPSFTFSQPPGYLKHNIEVIKWAKEKHLRVSLVLAVYNDAKEYIENTFKYVCYLIYQNAIPDEIVIGGYEDGGNSKKEVLPLVSPPGSPSLLSVAEMIGKGNRCNSGDGP